MRFVVDQRAFGLGAFLAGALSCEGIQLCTCVELLLLSPGNGRRDELIRRWVREGEGTDVELFEDVARLKRAILDLARQKSVDSTLCRLRFVVRTTQYLERQQHHVFSLSLYREARQLGWLPRDAVEERLVEAIVARDRQARTVYADWLEDRGDVARATFIRNLGDDGDDGGIAGHAPLEGLGEAWLRAVGWLTEADEDGGALGAACRDRHCELNFGHGGTHWRRYAAGHGNVFEDTWEDGKVSP